MESSKKETINIDEILTKLLSVKDLEPSKQHVEISESDIVGLCNAAKEIIKSQPILQRIPAPVIVCGDINEHFSNLLKIFETGGHPPKSSYAFLGNYINDGKQGIETILLLLAYKVKHPDRIFLLRGSSETTTAVKDHSFHETCEKKFGMEVWTSLADLANYLPVAAIIEDKIFCMHGGLNPELVYAAQISRIGRPTQVPEEGILCDLIWGEPSDQVENWEPNKERGFSIRYGKEIITNFLKKNNFELICRSHNLVQSGYEFMVDKKFVTIFSAANCFGKGNLGAVMFVDQNLKCTFFTYDENGLIKKDPEVLELPNIKVHQPTTHVHKVMPKITAPDDDDNLEDPDADA